MKKFFISFFRLTALLAGPCRATFLMIVFAIFMSQEIAYAIDPPPADYTFTIAQSGANFSAQGFSATDPGTPIVIAPRTSIQDVIDDINDGRESEVKKLIFGTGTPIHLNTESAILAQGVYIFEGQVSSNSGTIGTLRLQNNSSFYMVSGEIHAEATGYALNNTSPGNIYIMGGTISSELGRGIHNNSTGIITIAENDPNIPTDIKITQTPAQQTGGIAPYCIYLEAAGTVRETRLFITGGTLEVNCNYAVYGACVYNASIGKIEMSGGTLLSAFGYGIYNTTGGMEMSNGYIYCKGIGSVGGGAFVCSAVCLANPGTLGTLKVTGGTIRCDFSAAISCQGMSPTTINIYQDDENVPTIISSGINTSGMYPPGAIYLQNMMGNPTLNVWGGKIISDGFGAAFTGCCIRVREAANINIYGGELIAEDGIAVDLDYNGNFNMYDGLIDARGESLAILSRYNFILNFYGGTIRSDVNSTIWFDVTTSSGRLNITQSNPEIPALITSRTLASDNRGTLQLGSVIGSNLQVVVTNGTIENLANGPTIHNISPVSVTINGGTVSSLNNRTIYWGGSGTLTIGETNANNPTLITSANTNTASGTIHLNSGSLTITCGEINNTYPTGNIIYNPNNRPVTIPAPSGFVLSPDIHKPYDGTGIVSATPVTCFRTPTFEYEWFKDNEAIENSNYPMLNVPNVIQSGSYVVKVKSLFEGYVSAVRSSNPIIVDIWKAIPAPPPAPFLVSKTYHSVTLLGNPLYDFSIDGVSWQTSNVFDGLIENTTYTFYQRKAETANYAPSPASPGLNVTTNVHVMYSIQFGPSAAQDLGGSVFLTDMPDVVNYILLDSGTFGTQFSIVPAQGFVIDKVLVDNIENTLAALTGTYTFLTLNSNHTIFATFKPIMFTITATSSYNGTISPNGTVSVAYGANRTFEAVPNHGYNLIAVYVDGVYNATATSTGIYTFENVTANHTISAVFAIDSYTIYTIAGPNGYISPENPIVGHGFNQTINFYPNEGYQIEQVMIDGVSYPSAVLAGSFTFMNVTQNHTISVLFSKRMLKITATHTVGGEIVPSGVAYIEYGSHSEIYVFAAQEGHHVKYARIDGVNNSQAVYDGEYRFMDVTTNHTIHIVFEPDQLTIIASASEGGSINQNGVVPVFYGEDKLFFFAPFEGYELTRVLIDNINDTEAVAAGNYLFTNISINHTIEAQFDKKLYDIIYEVVPGALVISVEGYSSPVEYGSSYRFKIQLEEGYSQSNILVRVNGMAFYPAAGVYVISNICADQIITIEGVVMNKYEIVAQAFTGGTITPAGIFVVTHGENKTFDMIPNAGYIVSDVVVNGESKGAVSTHTIYDIRGNSTIKAYFTIPQGIDPNEEATIAVFSHNNIVTIQNENLIPIQYVEIIDMYGRVVWTGQAPSAKNDITLHVASGIYGVRITTESNTSTTKVAITK